MFVSFQWLQLHVVREWNTSDSKTVNALLSLTSSLDPITVEWDRWLHYDCTSTGYFIPDQKDSVEFV